MATDVNIEDVAAEAEQDHKEILAIAWSKIAESAIPSESDWAELITAERINRMHFLNDEASGKRKRKPKMSDILGAVIDSDGNLTKAKPKTRKTRARKPKA